MAWPAGIPVDQRIVSNLVTTLQGIVAGGVFKTTVRMVKVAGKDVPKLDSFPAILIQQPRVTYDDRTAGILRGDMFVMMQAVVRSDGDAIPSLLSDLIADVRVALLADYTRGGDAQDTSMQSSEPYALVDGYPLFGADIQVSILFRHLYADPATAT